MIRVWADDRPAGVLDRMSPRGATFACEPAAAPSDAVSLTMPVRVQSWDWPRGLHPIFEMNVPEGALKERLVRTFAKATGRFDELDLLAVVGRSQIGRLRYSGRDEIPTEEAPFQSVDEILGARRGGGLFEWLLERFARFSGLSGVQPKVLVRDPERRERGKTSSGASARRSSTLQGATHIVKWWDPTEYPELAANEFFCLRAAERMGLPVPPVELSASGDALVVERFDLDDGRYLGFEDFCVLNALNTADKYAGGYETRLFKRARAFLDPASAHHGLERLFQLVVACVAVRNGDAHLKNFGVLYPSVDGPAELAPAYDVVTTTAYLPGDQLALTLDGTTRWPEARRLLHLGQTRADLGAAKVQRIFERAADALADTAGELRGYFRACPTPEVGDLILRAWEAGIRDSLGLTRSFAAPHSAGPAVLAFLEANAGAYHGTLRALAGQLGLPDSTVAGAVRRLVARGSG
jgi:serine/threonine-protein kinase HipA